MASQDNPNPVPTRKYMSWRDIDGAARSVVQQVMTANYSPTHILAVGRGGLIPASIVAYWYSVLSSNSPALVTLYARSYRGEAGMQQGELQIAVNDLDMLKQHGSNVLIVDDICDSGATFSALQQLMPDASTAALFFKSKSQFKPTYHGPIDVDGDKYWYVFPWDRKIRDKA